MPTAYKALIALLTLCLMVLVLAYWSLIRSNPWRRLAGAARFEHSLGYKARVVLFGDSILASIGAPCPDIANLSVPGAKSSEVPDYFIEEAARLVPSGVIIMMGINDLRYTGNAFEASENIKNLGLRIKAQLPKAKIVLLTPLPIKENTLALAATNRAISETADMLKSELGGHDLRLVDFSQFFGKSHLDEQLTDDGLHLNASGASQLAEFIKALATNIGADSCRA